MFRVITKRHKHTRRRGTMRKKNPTMRRRHSSHLKHSRRNLHKSRSRRGGAPGGNVPEQVFAYTLKGIGKVKGKIDNALAQADIQRRQQEGVLLRARLNSTRPNSTRQSFTALRGSKLGLIPNPFDKLSLASSRNP